MIIPNWVDRGKRSNSEKASARLKYLMATLASRHTARSSLRGLAEMVGMDHSTLSIYIRRGEFSAAAAHRIVESLKETTVKPAMLIDPMSIPKAPG